jgi:LruC domain-containing protein
MRIRTAQASLLAASSLLFALPARAQDSDADGVANSADTFPCDVSLASVQYVPSQTGWMMLTFEDQWPSYTDLDYNDVVVRTHLRIYRDAQQRAKRVSMFFDPVALGGDFSNGLAVQLPVLRTGASVRRRVGVGSWQTLTLEGDDNATAILSPNLRELHADAKGRINSRANEARLEGQNLEVEFEFATPVALDGGLAPFDLFIFRAGNFAHQIHFPQYRGTQAMSGALFNTENDVSTQTRSFVLRQHGGTPAALNLQTTSRYPTEGTRVEELFPDIVGWAGSAGNNNKEFYLTGFVPEKGHSVNARSMPAEPAIDYECLNTWQLGDWQTCTGGSAAYSYGGWEACSGGSGSWSYGSWGPCSASAVCTGVGTQTRTGTCNVTSNSGSETRSSTCLWTAGSGNQTRSVGCISRLGAALADARCLNAKPSTQQACTPGGAPSCTGTALVSQPCTPTGNGPCGNATLSQGCNSPSGSQACTVPNGTGTQTCAAGATSWTACVATSCNAGFHVEVGACVPDTRVCAIANGSGTQTWTGSAYGTCTPTSCSAGYHIEAGACLPDTRSCTIANGTGSQAWSPATSSYGPCTVVSCNADYYASSTTVCSSLTYSWDAGNWGTCTGGATTFSYGAWGSCTGGSGTWAYDPWGACSVTAVCGGVGSQSRTASCTFTANSGSQSRTSSCGWTANSGSQSRSVTCVDNLGNTVADGKCVLADKPGGSQSCTPTGTATCTGSPVTAQSCTPTDSAVCGAATLTQSCNSPSGSRACTITNGTGSQSCLAGGTSWSACTPTSCNASYHIESGACLPDVKACAIANGTGSQTWNPSTGTYGTCTPTSCSATYHIESGACLPDVKVCPITNGAGSQTWNPSTSTYGACTPTGCNTGYFISGSVCQLRTWAWVYSGWGTCSGGTAYASYGGWGTCTGGTSSWTYGGWGTCTGGTANPVYGAWGACTGGSGSWSYGGWGDCSASAVCSGTGSQTRSATCIFTANSGSQTRFLSSCTWNLNSGSQSRTATCNWDANSGSQSRTGSCVWNAGSGSQSRTATCTSNDGQTDGTGGSCGPRDVLTQSCTPSGTPSSCGTLVLTQSCTPGGTPSCSGAVTTQSCTPGGSPVCVGSQTQACTPTDPGVCGAATTSQACSSPAGSQSCGIVGGTGTQSCSTGSTTWSACSRVSCNGGWITYGSGCARRVQTSYWSLSAADDSDGATLAAQGPLQDSRSSGARYGNDRYSSRCHSVGGTGAYESPVWGTRAGECWVSGRSESGSINTNMRDDGTSWGALGNGNNPTYSCGDAGFGGEVGNSGWQCSGTFGSGPSNRCYYVRYCH